jgi:ubiquinone/menaquinone biosynthesis C-methylase UbiE
VPVLAPLVRRVVSVSSDKEIKKLKDTKNIEYGFVDVTNLEILFDCTFDRVFYINSLSKIPKADRVKSLKEGYRLLKEFGLIIICEEVKTPLRMTFAEREKATKEEKLKFIKNEKKKLTTNKLIEKIKEADFLNISFTEMKIDDELVSVIIGEKQGG